jgi:hypothetical protein
MRGLLLSIVLAGVVALIAPSAAAQCQHAKLAAGDGAPFENYGRRVSIDGDYAAVGAPNHTHSTLDQAGAVYVYVRSGGTWSLDAEIIPADAAATDLFGYSVSIKGKRLAIGAIFEDDNGTDAGAVYVYFRDDVSGWGLEQKLVSSAMEDQESFGRSVSLDGGRLVIGSLLGGTGAAYVFELGMSGWSEITSVTPSAAAAGLFGEAVSLEGDRFIVGARGTDDPVGNAGAAFVFHETMSGWVEEAYITSPNPTQVGQFGTSVDISGTRIAVGAPFERISSVATGRAYTYTLVSGTWTLEHSFTDTGLASNDQYGGAISLSGVNILIGARFADTSVSSSGAVYYHQHDGSAWNAMARLEANDASNGQSFGNSIQIRSTRIVIGAEGDGGFNQGAAYIFGRCP